MSKYIKSFDQIDSLIVEGVEPIVPDGSRKYNKILADLQEKIEDHFLSYIDQNQSQKLKIEISKYIWSTKGQTSTPKLLQYVWEKKAHHVRVYRFTINLKVYLDLNKVNSIVAKIKNLPELKYLYHDVTSKLSYYKTQTDYGNTHKGSTEIEIYFSLTQEINDKQNTKVKSRSSSFRYRFEDPAWRKSVGLPPLVAH